MLLSGSDSLAPLCHSAALPCQHTGPSPYPLHLAAGPTAGTFACRQQVGDFGLSRFAAEDAVTTRLGTVSHMPPELLREGQVGKYTDAYSFGVLLQEVSPPAPAARCMKGDYEVGVLVAGACSLPRWANAAEGLMPLESTLRLPLSPFARRCTLASTPSKASRPPR